MKILFCENSELETLPGFYGKRGNRITDLCYRGKTGGFLSVVYRNVRSKFMKNRWFAVAYVNKIPVGIAVVHKTGIKKVFLDVMAYVKSTHRRKGIATKLVKSVLEYSGESGTARAYSKEIKSIFGKIASEPPSVKISTAKE